ILIRAVTRVTPFCIDDAVVDSVAHASVAHDFVLTKNPLALCAKSLDCGARPSVAYIGLNLDSKRAPAVEGVLQHQGLRFTVDTGALTIRAYPCPSDFHPMVVQIDRGEARRSDHFTRRRVGSGEGECLAGITLSQRD